MIPFITFVAFDLETTGLKAGKDEIIEVAGVKFTLERTGGKLMAKKTGQYSSFIRPNMFIPKEATRINNISDSMVDDAPQAKEVLKDFIRFCGLSTILVAHNAPFDSEFLAKTLKRNGMIIPQNPIVDNLKISKKIMMEAPSYRLGDLARRLGDQLNLKFDSESLHRALYDCEVLMEVFCACLRKRFQDSELSMDKAVDTVERLHGPLLRLKQYA